MNKYNFTPEMLVLLLTITLVISFGWITFHSLIPSPTISILDDSSVHTVEMINLFDQRSPSSVKISNEQIKPILESSDKNFSPIFDLHWNCDSMEQSLYKNVTKIRINSSHCLKKGLRLTKVKNITNGFDASLFYHKNYLTTDYIELDKGKNEISFVGLNDRQDVIKEKIVLLRKEDAIESK